MSQEIFQPTLRSLRPFPLSACVDALSFVSVEGDDMDIKFGLPDVRVGGVELPFELFAAAPHDACVRLRLPYDDMPGGYGIELVDPRCVPLLTRDRLTAVQLKVTRLGETVVSESPVLAKGLNARVIMTATMMAEVLRRHGHQVTTYLP